nr:hypothetical protein [Bacteroides intestinalis]
MKTTKIISALLLPALFAACSDDTFEGNSIQNNEGQLVKDLSIITGINSGTDASTRSGFAGGEKGFFDNFYFEPAFDSNDLDLTDNSEIKGDQVGLCLPNPTGNGNVLTNVPFYIAGYQATPEEGKAAKIFSLERTNDFYNITGQEGSADAFDERGEANDQAKFEAMVTARKDAVPAAGKVDITKSVFKTVAGVMTGNYILYSPFNKAFVDPTKPLPAVELKTIQTQTKAAIASTANIADHVLGINLFAYSKAPFKVDGTNNAAKEMSMTPAAYFFQFKIYTSGSEMDKSDDPIKLITVATADDAKAFAKTGHVQAGATNSFIADATTAADMIGVDFGTNIKAIPSATAETKNASALSVYLSTYPVKTALVGKDIVVKLYTEKGKVATITKAAAGSAIVEGGTDYWNIDLNGVKFEEADRLVYNKTTLEAELGGAAGTLIMKNDITTTVTAIDHAFTIKGENYTLTLNNDITLNDKCNFECKTLIPAGKTLTVKKDATFATLDNKGTIAFGTDATTLTATTINNEGTITVSGKATLKATTINNKAVKATAAKLTVEYTAADNQGTLMATTINNAAGVVNKNDASKTTLDGEIEINGAVANTKIVNAGTLKLEGLSLASTVTVENAGEFNIGKNGQTTRLDATIVNDGSVNIISNSVADNYGKITNNGEITNNGVFTLLGSGQLINNGLISDLGTFSGLSRLTNSADAQVIRAVDGLTNLTPALAEAKITAVRINGDVNTGTSAITTDKTIYLNANLTLPVAADKVSTIGKIVFEGANKELTGNVKTNSIDVNNNATIKATSNVVVDGDITIAKSQTLTGEANSYTICNDIKGEGSKAGTIYVK